MAIKVIRTVSGLAMAMGVMLSGAALGAGAADAKEAKKKDPSKRVCQTITPSGTRLVERVCRTQQEWDDQAHATQDSVLAHQHKNTTTSPISDLHAGNPR